jgi:PAS domain S-box-containing protein
MKDGSLQPAIIFTSVYRQDAELLYFAFIGNLDQYRQIEEQLRVTQFAMDRFTDPSVWLDAGGHIIYANEAACRSLGYTRDELQSMKVWLISPRDSPKRYGEIWKYAKATGHIEFQITYMAKDGREFPAEVHASYIRFGDMERLICFTRDISERKLAEEALAESEEKFRVLADTSLSGIYLVQENKFVYVNPAALASLGYSADELIGMDFWMPIHPEFREEMKKYAMALLHGLLIPGRFEIKFVRKNGETGWADMAIAPIRYRGRPAGVVTAMDITERKHAELALAESEEKFRVLSELSPTAIFLYQGDKLIYANPTAVALTGFTMGELLTSLAGENGANRERFQRYIVDLAAQREQEYQIMDHEAQRCRDMLLRQPPPAKKSNGKK